MLCTLNLQGKKKIKKSTQENWKENKEGIDMEKRRESEMKDRQKSQRTYGGGTRKSFKKERKKKQKETEELKDVWEKNKKKFLEREKKANRETSCYEKRKERKESCLVRKTERMLRKRKYCEVVMKD